VARDPVLGEAKRDIRILGHAAEVEHVGHEQNNDHEHQNQDSMHVAFAPSTRIYAKVRF
jgi:hypothetical protein